MVDILLAHSYFLKYDPKQLQKMRPYAPLATLYAASALAAVAFYSRTLSQGQLLARIGLALIIGGAAGNLLDRIIAGSVVDFVDVYWRTYHFWAFNVADSAISVGVAIMILDMLGIGNRVSKAA